MKKQRIKVAAERVITIILVGALIFGTELAGVFALDMSTGETVVAESADADESEDGNIEESGDEIVAVTEESEKQGEEDQNMNLSETEEAVNKQQSTDADTETIDADNLISGVIWLDENEDGIMDEDEPLIRNYPVSLYQDDRLIDTVKTNADGSYSFENLKAGDYVIEVQPEIIGEIEYLIPLCGISGDNKFKVTEKEDEEIVALSDPISVSADTRIEDMNAGMREPMEVVATANETYVVSRDTGESIGAYNSLADAVSACPDGVACTITATRDDELSALVEIPAGKEITLTSAPETECWTIRQTATTMNLYQARHFYVQGSLTLDNVVLIGVGYTAAGGTYNGGVYVTHSGKLNMINDAMIEQCYNDYGGGVCVSGSNAKFEMNGGKIHGNEAGDDGGGVYIDDYATFVMNQGEISNNKAGDDGGGVYVVFRGMSEMTGGEISKNYSTRGGGVFCIGSFGMDGGQISGNEADYGGGVYLYSTGIGLLEMSDGEISANMATVDGGGIYTTTYSYDNPVSTNYYSNITINGTSEVKGNSAGVRYRYPDNYGEVTRFPGKLLNNDDINYKGTYQVYLVTYNANNDTTESCFEEVTAGSGSVSISLLTESDTDFTVPGTGYVLAGWNMKADGSGIQYDPGTRITIDRSVTFYAVWQLDPYIVTTEDDTLIGTYTTLAKAVAECQDNTACTITVTRDDTLLECVTIPSAKKITLSSWDKTDPVTIIQSANQRNNGSGAIYRHFYVSGDLTLENIFLSGLGYTSSSSMGYNGGVYIEPGGKFTMRDNTLIERCYNYYGGGVCVEDNGQFTMCGGEISGNAANAYGGGVYIDGGSTFEISGGMINENEIQIAGSGGGVYVGGGSTFEMIGGEISENKVFIYRSTRALGGGVYVGGGSTFDMKDGKINGNIAYSRGGGVYVGGDSSFKMTGGEIRVNKAYEDGGGIYTEDYSYVNPTDRTKYANITIDDKAEVNGNTASAKYVVPENYAEFTKFPGQLLNNNEINYKGCYLITYGANDDTKEKYIQEASSGTGSVSITLLADIPDTFTEPVGYTLAGWNTQEDGKGTYYLPGETITINDSLTLYAVWQQGIYEITEAYQLADGTLIQDDTIERIIFGDDYEKTAPVLSGYQYLGYKIDDGVLQSGTAVTIAAVEKAHIVTYVYEEYSETIHVSVPVKLMWAAFESDDGEVISPDYYFYNHSSYDISVTLQELTVIHADGLDLVDSSTAGSGADEVALQLDPVTDSGTGWRELNRISLLADSNGDGLLGKIKAGGQGRFGIIGTYGGDFTGFDLGTGEYLQPEYEAVFKIELTH